MNKQSMVAKKKTPTNAYTKYNKIVRVWFSEVSISEVHCTVNSKH